MSLEVFEMKYKRIMLFFVLATVISVLVRALQVMFTIDDKGFSIDDYKNISYAMLVIQFLAVGVATFLGALVHRYPEKPPVVGPVLAVASALLGIWIIADLIMFAPPVSVPMWQSALIKFFGLLSGIILVVYSLSKILPIKLPSILFVVPVLFWVMRLIWAFTTINTLALTSGHILLLITYCSVLVFFLELAKLMNGIDKEYNFKKLLATGICSTTLCFTFSVPYIINTVLGGSAATVEGYSPVLLLFVTGCFNAVFLFCYFNNNNLRKRRHRRHHTRILNIDAKVDRFYTGD